MQQKHGECSDSQLDPSDVSVRLIAQDNWSSDYVFAHRWLVPVINSGVFLLIPALLL